jgi:hypothetical protein
MDEKKQTVPVLPHARDPSVTSAPSDVRRSAVVGVGGQVRECQACDVAVRAAGRVWPYRAGTGGAPSVTRTAPVRAQERPARTIIPVLAGSICLRRTRWKYPARMCYPMSRPGRCSAGGLLPGTANLSNRVLPQLFSFPVKSQHIRRSILRRVNEPAPVATGCSQHTKDHIGKIRG